jgi:hypothetical protein
MPLPQIRIPGLAQAAIVYVEITDARTGDRYMLVPDQVDESGAMIKWSGPIDEATSWFLVQTAQTAGELDLVGAVVSSEEHCFRLTVGVNVS